MQSITTHKDQKPGHETDPKRDNPDWYFMKVKDGEDDGQLVGTVLMAPKSYLEHKETWRPCNGQLLKRSEYPRLEAMIHASGADNYFHGDMIQIPNLNGVQDAE